MMTLKTYPNLTLSGYPAGQGIINKTKTVYYDEIKKGSLR
jgi:hypothetical protein